jgi:hypothetical protein
MPEPGLEPGYVSDAARGRKPDALEIQVGLLGD